MTLHWDADAIINQEKALVGALVGAFSVIVKTDGSFAALDNKCSLVPPTSALCLVSGQRLGPVNSSSYSAAHVPAPARPPQPRRRLSMIRTFWQKE